jgi:hypothetical protein
MELSATTGQEPIAAADTMRIEDRGGVAYRSEVSSGGSGGDEGVLGGTVRLAGAVVHVECHIQDEWSVHAEWCLYYLRSLRVTP